MPYKPAKRKTCEAIHWSIAVLVILCILSAILSVVLGVLIAKPGILGLDFKAATCVVKSFRTVPNLSCDCSGIYSDDPNCESHFPCYQVEVGYEPRKQVVRHNETEEYFQNEVLIRETEADFSSRHTQCSFQYCHPEYKHNKIVAEAFRKKYGKIGDFYPCLYNPHRTDQVIVSRRYDTTHILLVLIIPPALFLLSLIILVTICAVHSRNVKKKKAEHPVENPFKAPRSYLGQDMPAFQPDEAVDDRNKLPDPFASINNMFSDKSESKRTEAEQTPEEYPSQGHEDGAAEDLNKIVPQSAQMSTAM